MAFIPIPLKINIRDDTETDIYKKLIKNDADAYELRISLIGFSNIDAIDTVEVFFKNPAGTLITDEANKISDGEYSYVIKSNVIAVSGKLQLTVRVYEGTTRITSKVFNFNVGDELGDISEAIEGSDEYPILTTLIAETKEARDSAFDAAEAANEAAESANAAATLANAAAALASEGFDKMTGTTIVYVSKKGNDNNDGSIGSPKLTIGAAITAAAAKIDGSNPQAAVVVLDAGRYTENITLQDNVHLIGEIATIIGRINIRNNCKVSIYAHYASESSQYMLYKDGTAHAYYRAVISDGRGIAGNLTGTSNIYNITSSSILFTEVELMFVTTNGMGVREHSSTTGHIHYDIRDLYLAGNGARGIYAQGQASNIIGKLDHILEVGSPTNTTAIQINNPDCVVRVTAVEIIADIAYNISAGSLYLNCPKIEGAKIGTPMYVPITKAEHDAHKALTIREAYSPQKPSKHKKTVSGYGSVATPNNANGGVDITILGNTETDDDNIMSTVASMRLKSVGKNLFDLQGAEFINTVGGAVTTKLVNGINVKNTTPAAWRSSYCRITGLKPGQAYTVKANVMIRSGIAIISPRTSTNALIPGTLEGNVSRNYIANFVAQPDGICHLFFMCTGEDSVLGDVDYTNIQLELGNTATPYEPYIESECYIVAKDGANIAQLRRLPNGVKDEIKNSKMIKRVSNIYALQANDIITVVNQTNITIAITNAPFKADFPTGDEYAITGKLFIPDKEETYLTARDNVNNVGKWYLTASKRLDFILPLGTTLTQAREQLEGTMLIYELAAPIELNIDIVGELVTYPNGDITAEPSIWGFITESKKIVTSADLPISAVRKVIRYDISDTGHLVETDVTSDVTVGDSNTSLIIANFEQGKTYFYDCSFDTSLTTLPEIEASIEVDNGVISHDYGAANAPWNLTSNEAKATMLICTNAGGAAQIVAPAQDGKIYVIKNDSGQNITIKTQSSTGVTVATSKVVTVIYTGSDFIKIAEV